MALYYTSPVGILELKASDRGLQSLTTVEQVGEFTAQPHGIEQLAFEQLTEYFKGKRQDFELPLDLSVGTVFQQKVWQALQTIPFGQVISYAQLAEKVGSPAAFRAVGSANGANPVAIIVPCHRVINKSGKLGGYALGLDMKKYLLKLENKI